jgi:hypothetical protein
MVGDFMAGIPGYCRHCGLTFESSLSLGHTVMGMTHTCPRCGKMAGLANVMHSPDGSRVHISNLPRESLVAFQALLKKRYENTISAQDFENQSSKLSPQLGQAAKKINSSPAVSAAILAVLVTLASNIEVKTNIDIKIDAAEITRTIAGKSPKEILDQVPLPPDDPPHTSSVERDAGHGRPKSNRTLNAQKKATHRKAMNPRRAMPK